MTKTKLSHRSDRRLKKSGLEGYYTADEVGAALGLNRYTLANWRSKHIGPPSIKIGKNIFYRTEALHQWIVSQERDPAKKAKKEKMKHIAKDQLPFATPPYSWEHIATRSIGKYRIKDSRDNAVGWADSEVEANALVKELNLNSKIYRD